MNNEFPLRIWRRENYRNKALRIYELRITNKMLPESIQKLIDLFVKFPTVGPRTAARFVFYLLKLPKKEIEEIIKSISELQENVKLCNFCFKPFQFFSPPAPTKVGAEAGLCEICTDPRRDKNLLCLVEKETDLEAIEKTNQYKGLYFILGGVLPSLKKESSKELEQRIKDLDYRIKNPQNFGFPDESFQEIIIALNPTAEGEVTALKLEKILKPFGKKITRLGRGLPLGGELEYADEETLSSALKSRR